VSSGIGSHADLKGTPGGTGYGLVTVAFVLFTPTKSKRTFVDLLDQGVLMFA